MFEITIQNHNYISKRLEKSENAINRIAGRVTSSAFELAYIIAQTASTVTAEDFAADGFADVHDWVCRVFGLKKSMSYNLLKIGNFWTTKIGKGASAVYRDNITNPDGIGYTTSQIIQMLPYGYDTAVNAHVASFINPSMSCREIAENLKKFVSGETDETDETETDETETENAQKIVHDENGNTYSIPEKILSKYAVI